MIDIQACRRSLDKRREIRHAANRRLWERARADADRLIEFLATHYQPDRIVQWGSVLHPDKFGPRSDIDLGLEGNFSAETWFRLLGEAWLMTDFPLDIVDLTRIEPEFADIIRMKGKVVYERRAPAH